MFGGKGGTGLLGARPEFWPHKLDDLGTRELDMQMLTGENSLLIHLELPRLSS